MQTFLPYESFKETAKCLDRQRLGKQRVEAWQILQTLQGYTKGWRHHPAVKMWRNSLYYLCKYGISICDEWIKRGYRDSMQQRFLFLLDEIKIDKKPRFLGSQQFHASHRAALLKKYPEWYGRFGWKEKPDINYFWPV